MKIGLIVSVLVFLLVGCNEYERITGQEFKKQYELRNMQTMHYAEYLGQRGGKAFMSIKSMSSTNQREWKERIVYCEMSELDPSMKNTLQAEGKTFEPKKQEK